MKQQDFEDEISIPQAKALFNRGVYIEDDLFLIDNIIASNLPHNKKKTKCVVILICEEGEIRFESDGHTITAGENDVVLLNIGQVIDNNKVMSSNYRGKAILINPNELPMLAEDFSNTAHLRGQLTQIDKIKLNEQEMTHSNDDFYQIADLLKNTYPNKSTLAINLIKIILQIAIAKSYRNHKKLFKKSEQQFEAFTLLVDQYVSISRHVSEYCKRLGISSTQLEHIVREYTGYTPLKYIHGKLLNRICIIAESTSISQMPNKKIAEWVHFSSFSAFSRFIQQNLHMSLTKYRHLKSDQQLHIIRRTILDQTAALKDLPKSDIQASQAPLLFG